MTPQEALRICELATTCATADLVPDEFQAHRTPPEIIKQIAKKHELETLITCIQKQIPAKPSYRREPRCGERDTAHCPRCDNFYGLTLANYCSVCGQRILWEDEE